MNRREQNRSFTHLDLVNARLFYSKISSPKIYSGAPDAASMFCRLRARRFFSNLLNIRTSEARETIFTKDGMAVSSFEVFYDKRATVNKGRELMEAISKRGEIGFFDSAAKPADYVVAAAEEILSAAWLANGELIFVGADSLMATAFGKSRFAESFQDVPHHRRTAQTSIGSGHTESNRTNSNPANFNQQNLMAVDACESDADGRIVVPASPKKLYSAEMPRKRAAFVSVKSGAKMRGGLMNRERKREVHLEISPRRREPRRGQQRPLDTRGQSNFINQKQK